jgi:altronate dehydratase large subunit
MGAEHILARRMVRSEDAQRLVNMVEKVESRAKLMGVDLRGGNPSPGNIVGGITTIEEKSLGAIYKAGTGQIKGVLGYADEIPKESGLYFMDSPGQDVESLTGMVASGANVIIFTTGRGTPVGFPVAPVIKVTGNSETYMKMKDNIDLNVGTIIEGGETLEKAGTRIFQKILRTASGRLTKAEQLGQAEFAIYRLSSSF